MAGQSTLRPSRRQPRPASPRHVAITVIAATPAGAARRCTSFLAASPRAAVIRRHIAHDAMTISPAAAAGHEHEDRRSRAPLDRAGHARRRRQRDASRPRTRRSARAVSPRDDEGAAGGDAATPMASGLRSRPAAAITPRRMPHLITQLAFGACHRELPGAQHVADGGATPAARRRSRLAARYATRRWADAPRRSAGVRQNGAAQMLAVIEDDSYRSMPDSRQRLRRRVIAA